MVAFSDPQQSGNSFGSNGLRVRVEASGSAQPGGEAAAEIVMNADTGAATASGRRNFYFEKFGGFTPEERAFRTKWGWAAFDQAQRLANGFDR